MALRVQWARDVILFTTIAETRCFDITLKAKAVVRDSSALLTRDGPNHFTTFSLSEAA